MRHAVLVFPATFQQSGAMILRKILLGLVAAAFIFAPNADAKDKYIIGLVAKSQGNPVFQAARA